jgi:hypothetical protein
LTGVRAVPDNTLVAGDRFDGHGQLVGIDGSAGADRGCREWRPPGLPKVDAVITAAGADRGCREWRPPTLIGSTPW